MVPLSGDRDHDNYHRRDRSCRVASAFGTRLHYNCNYCCCCFDKIIIPVFTLRLFIHYSFIYLQPHTVCKKNVINTLCPSFKRNPLHPATITICSYLEQLDTSANRMKSVRNYCIVQFSTSRSCNFIIWQNQAIILSVNTLNGAAKIKDDRLEFTQSNPQSIY